MTCETAVPPFRRMQRACATRCASAALLCALAVCVHGAAAAVLGVVPDSPLPPSLRVCVQGYPPFSMPKASGSRSPDFSKAIADGCRGAAAPGVCGQEAVKLTELLMPPGFQQPSELSGAPQALLRGTSELCCTECHRRGDVFRPAVSSSDLGLPAPRTTVQGSPSRAANSTASI